MVKCPECSKELVDGAKFCGSCGAEVGNTIENTAVSIEKKNKPSKKGLYIVVITAVILILFAAVAWLLLFNNIKKSENNFALYIKDNEMIYTDLKKNSEPWQITSELLEDDVDVGPEFFLYHDLQDYVTVSEDEKYIFFLDKFEMDEYGNTNKNLYYRELGEPEADAVKIDSDVAHYIVNSSADIITYTKGENDNLYQYSIRDDSKEKIDKKVQAYFVSDDGNKIVYLNSEGNVYLKYTDKNKENIISDVFSIQQVTDDLSTMYYYKDECLCRYDEGEGETKISSDIYRVCKIYDTGEIYYLTSEPADVSLMDYVNDDMKDADASVYKPEQPDYPDYPDYPPLFYNSAEEHEAAYAAYEKAYAECKEETERLSAEYDLAYEEYLDKTKRDDLRAELEEIKIERANYSLCFLDKSGKVSVVDTFVGEDYYYDYEVAFDTPVVFYRAPNQDDFEKINLSEVESVYDVESMVENEFSSYYMSIAFCGNATVIEQESENAELRSVNESGTIAYYINNTSEENYHGDLYRINISHGAVEKPELYDTDVYYNYGSFINESEYAYIKDYNNGDGELYVNKTLIDYDVCPGFVLCGSKNNKLIYISDMNDDETYGTLKVYNDNETQKIADDVSTYTVSPEGNILYLYDYSFKSCKGELYEWSDGETRKIDDDVISLLHIFDFNEVSDLRMYHY